ncbi:MAG: phosphopantetheine-binding protein [Gammaproteobacteria bacterium]|nr:phosphopantetheine-binding protein [Gammaproteobacteria bacterium]
MKKTDTRSEIETTVISVLTELVEDWDLEMEEELNANTRLIADLGFESIDVVQFAVSLEQSFGKDGLPFERLFMRNGDYVEEILVCDVVQFLENNL